MNQSTILLPGAIVLACIWCLTVVVDSAPPKDARCTPWVFGQCQQMDKGTCGKGIKKGTRTGEGCAIKEKQEKCKVQCPGDKKGCKYEKGSFGECDPVTLKRTRIDTLNTEISDATCEASKKMEKNCRKKCAFGPWVEGVCENGKMTVTRAITSGGDECRRKATKTRRCGGAGGGRRRGGGGGRQ